MPSTKNSSGVPCDAALIPVGTGTGFSTMAYSVTPSANKLMQWGSNGAIISAPPASSTATAAFGSVALNTVKQNTLGYDILINVSVVITAALGGSLSIGVSPTSPPATNAITNSITIGLTTTFCAYIPAGYYFIMTSTGTITLGAIITQACAI